MNPLLLGPVMELGKTFISRIFPDKEAANKAEAEFLTMITTQEFSVVMAQLEINAKEAAHPSIWVSGGRPFFIWIGGVGFLYAVLVHPILVWVSRIKGWPEPPEVNTDLLWVVISGLLGLGTLRSIEKVRKVATK